MSQDIVIATENEGKLDEIKYVLANALGEDAYTVRSLADFPHLRLPEETGNTFEENALTKAQFVYNETGLWSLADDSGLEVASLDGRPGVYSKRFAGPDATDEDNNDKLITELLEFQNGGRSASFRCVLAFVFDIPSVDSDLEDDIDILSEFFSGIVEGSILTSPKGENGFGYDPLFVPDGFDKTMAELSPEVKNSISHRGLALELFKEFLLESF